MELLQYLAQFIYFIIPGILFRCLSGYLLNLKETQQQKEILYIVLSSTLSFVVGNFVISLVNFSEKCDFEITNVTLILSNGYVSTASLIASIIASVFLSAAFVWIISNKIFFRIANIIKITTRADNDDVWDNLFENEPIIILRDYVSTHTYYGKVIIASDHADTREILLGDVHVFNECGESLYRMKQIYLSRTPSEFSVEIDNYTTQKKEN